MGASSLGGMMAVGIALSMPGAATMTVRPAKERFRSTVRSCGFTKS
jgi:hypothetical protein